MNNEITNLVPIHVDQILQKLPKSLKKLTFHYSKCFWINFISFDDWSPLNEFSSLESLTIRGNDMNLENINSLLVRVDEAPFWKSFKHLKIISEEGLFYEDSPVGWKKRLQKIKSICLTTPDYWTWKRILDSPLKETLEALEMRARSLGNEGSSG